MVMAPILATGTFEAKTFAASRPSSPKQQALHFLCSRDPFASSLTANSLGTVRLAAYKADEIFGPRCYSIVWADAFVHARLESLLLVAQMHSR